MHRILLQTPAIVFCGIRNLPGLSLPFLFPSLCGLLDGSMEQCGPLVTPSRNGTEHIRSLALSWDSAGIWALKMLGPRVPAAVAADWSKGQDIICISIPGAQETRLVLKKVLSSQHGDDFYTYTRSGLGASFFWDGLRSDLPNMADQSLIRST